MFGNGYSGLILNKFTGDSVVTNVVRCSTALAGGAAQGTGGAQRDIVCIYLHIISWLHNEQSIRTS